MLTEWDIPNTLTEAKERKRLLIAEVEEIQAQLGDRVRKANAPFDNFDAWLGYSTWRQKALWALTNRLEELRLVKQWIEAHAEERSLCQNCLEALV